MRLIDADVFKTEYENLITWVSHRAEKARLREFIKDIQNQPTIDAIPVERLENKLKCCDNINAEIFVKALIRDWEEENDFATNSRLGNRSNGDNDSNISSTTNSGVYKESITR